MTVFTLPILEVAQSCKLDSSCILQFILFIGLQRSLSKVSVLVCPSCCNKIPWPAWFKQQKFTSQFWRVGSSRPRCQPIWFLVRAWFSACRWLAAFPLCAHRARGRDRNQNEREFSLVSLLARTQVLSFSQGPTPGPHLIYWPPYRSYLQVSLLWGLGLQHADFGERDLSTEGSNHWKGPRGKLLEHW